jgi:hypothetical protein
MKKDGILRTGFHAFRVTSAKIAFKRVFDIIMNKNSSKGQDLRHFKRNTGIFINLNGSIFTGDGIYRASVSTFGNSALAANNRHPYYRVGVNDHNPDRSFFGVGNIKMRDGSH